NLVAKEFCAAQADERGVLIVSEFAGAGPELRHGAILVNPNDFAGVAQAIRDACLMTTDEKRTRMRLLRTIVKDHNVHRWARSFLQAAVPPETERQLTEPGNGGTSSSLKIRRLPSGEIPGVTLVAASLGTRPGQYSEGHTIRRTGSA